jgi:hypothetical protein
MLRKICIPDASEFIPRVERLGLKQGNHYKHRRINQICLGYEIDVVK